MIIVNLVYLFVLLYVFASDAENPDNSKHNVTDFWRPDPAPYRSLGKTLLILTDYIQNGSITEGLEAARVEQMVDGVQSYAGFFRLEFSGEEGDDKHGKEYVHYLIHFWYFPAEEDPEGAPVIFWVQGARASALVGLFYEHGPLDITHGTPAKRQLTWSKNNHVVYIDVIVGVGFSTEPEFGFEKPASMESIGEDMYVSVVQFFQLFPGLAKNDVFFAGEGYASKILICAAYEVLLASQNRRTRTNHKVNLKGLSLASPAVDPGFMMYAQHLAQLGLIDVGDLPQRLEDEKEFVGMYKSIDLLIFYRLHYTENIEDPYPPGWDWRWNHYLDPTLQLFYIRTEFLTKNYLEADRLNPLRYVMSPYGLLKWFFGPADMRKKVHVGRPNKNFFVDLMIEPFYNQLKVNVWYSDVGPILEQLLEHYRVLMYNGQQDVAFTYPNTQMFAKSLNWSGAFEYRSAERKSWYVGSDLAGFTRSGDNLNVAMVMGAGQMVSRDQPAFSLELVNKFVRNLPLKTHPSD